MEGPAFDAEGTLFTVATRQNHLIRWTAAGGNEIFAETPTGSVTPVTTEIDFPNGLCFSADWNTLYVADTWVQQILAFDVLADGSLGNRRLFAQMKTTLEGATQFGGPDGITMGADGNIY